MAPQCPLPASGQRALRGGFVVAAKKYIGGFICATCCGEEATRTASAGPVIEISFCPPGSRLTSTTRLGEHYLITHEQSGEPRYAATL